MTKVTAPCQNTCPLFSPGPEHPSAPVMHQHAPARRRQHARVCVRTSPLVVARVCTRRVRFARARYKYYGIPSSDLTRVSIDCEISSLLVESSAIFKRSGLPTTTHACPRLRTHQSQMQMRLKKLQHDIKDNYRIFSVSLNFL